MTERGFNHWYSCPSWWGRIKSTKLYFYTFPHRFQPTPQYILYQFTGNNNTLLLNECTNKFIIISNCDHTIFGIMSIMFFILSIEVLHKLDLEVLEFFYFGVVFEFAFQTCKNSCTYVFSEEFLSSLSPYHYVGPHRKST